MGHRELGGKTVAYLIDALYNTKFQNEVMPTLWTSAPFNNHWTSSLFCSQDPVAIDSVCLDVCAAEPQLDVYFAPKLDGTSNKADNFLHQAAQADLYPYDPEGDGSRLSSLGAHEHWNNATEKKYSRNLGSDSGIELVALTWAPVTFRNGYNLIALPVAPRGSAFTAESLAQHIAANSTPPVSCTAVIQYDGGAFVTHPVGTAVNNFPVAVGKGYFVRCSFTGMEATWTLAGCPLRDKIAGIGLAGGYNLIGLPRIPMSPYSAEDAGAEINTQTSGIAIQFVRYDAGLGQFVTHPIGTAVENFTLRRGEGYFIRCAGSATWTLNRP